MHPVTEQTLGQLGIRSPGADEIAQGAKHSAIETVTCGEQCRGSRGQAHPVALELLEGKPAGRELRERLFGLSPLGAVHGFMLAGFGDRMPGMLRRGGCALAFVAQKAGSLDCTVPAAFNGSQLLADLGRPGLSLRGSLT
jgi:hypothetical protein